MSVAEEINEKAAAALAELTREHQAGRLALVSFVLASEDGFTSGTFSDRAATGRDPERVGQLFRELKSTTSDAFFDLYDKLDDGQKARAAFGWVAWGEEVDGA